MESRRKYCVVILAVIAILIIPGYALGKGAGIGQEKVKQSMTGELVCNLASCEKNQVNYINMNNSDKNREQLNVNQVHKRANSKKTVSKQNHVRERIIVNGSEINDYNTVNADSVDTKIYKGNWEEYYEDLKQQPNKPVTKMEFLKCLAGIGGWDNKIIPSESSSVQVNMLKKIPDSEKGYVVLAMNQGFICEGDLKAFNPNQGIKKQEAYRYISRLLESADFILENESEVDGDLSVADKVYYEYSFNSNQVMKRKEFVGILDRLENQYMRIVEDSVEGIINSVKVIDDGFKINLDTVDGKEVTVKTNAMTRIIIGEKMYNLDFRISTEERAAIFLNDDGYAYLIKLLPNSDE